MTARKRATKLTAAKSLTGIAGFDEITGGGLPRGRTTLLLGGPGSGKTLFSLQFLVHGISQSAEPGIFVAFEETSRRIIGNAASFGWKLAQLQKTSLTFIDAQPQPDLVQSGEFDLGGLLAALGAAIKESGAKRIVFDALDIVLALMPDAATRRREVYRLHAWLLENEITAILTAKAGGDEASSSGRAQFDYMQFMVDCAVVLNHGVVQGVSQRNLRVQKYRGSAFDENESPFLISANGFLVAGVRTTEHAPSRVANERVSSGVSRLDTMLGGGYFRGASVLITGSPGTAKTTLSGSFAEAACDRGERTMLISFDSDGGELVRNLTSVGIRLEKHVKSGMLRVISVRTISGSAETYLVRIKAFAREHGARCLVIDPVSTFFSATNESSAHSVAERLIDWSKSHGITLICTSLLEESSQRTDDAQSLQISTLADTWIHLNYLVQAGERNRGLSIIKSRGTAHSNQVRELVLSDEGVTLSDIYTAGGEVLMGTQRWAKETEERDAIDVAEVADALNRVRIDAEAAELEVRINSLRVVLQAKQAEKALLIRTTKRREGDLSRSRAQIDDELRGADDRLTAAAAAPVTTS